MAEGRCNAAALEFVHLPVPVGTDPLVAGVGVGRAPVEAGGIGGAGIEKCLDYVGVGVSDIKSKAPFLGVLVQAVSKALGVAFAELDRTHVGLAAFTGRVDRVVTGESSHGLGEQAAGTLLFDQLLLDGKADDFAELAGLGVIALHIRRASVDIDNNACGAAGT